MKGTSAQICATAVTTTIAVKRSTKRSRKSRNTIQVYTKSSRLLKADSYSIPHLFDPQKVRDAISAQAEKGANNKQEQHPGNRNRIHGEKEDNGSDHVVCSVPVRQRFAGRNVHTPLDETLHGIADQRPPPQQEADKKTLPQSAMQHRDR